MQWKTSTFKRCLKNEKCCMNWYFSCVHVYKPFWIWLAIWLGTYFGLLNLYMDVCNFMMWVNLGIWAIFGQRVGVKLYTQGGQTAKWQTNFINVVLSTKKKKKKFCLSYHKIRILISVIIITTITSGATVTTATELYCTLIMHVKFTELYMNCSIFTQ